jgi:hypothetical protein
MAQNVGKSPVSALGKAIQAASANPVEWGQEFVELPGNIKGGFAQLVDAKFGEYKTGPNQGEKYIMLRGTVLEPVMADKITKVWENGPGDNPKTGRVKVVSAESIKIANQSTMKMLPMCETTTGQGNNAKTTPLGENVAEAMNHVQRLGGGVEGLKDEDDLTKLLEELKLAQPIFRFSTFEKDPTAQYPIPKVWQNWLGIKDVPEDYSPPVDSEVVDNSAKKPSVNGAPATAAEPAGDAGEFDAASADVATLVEIADGDPGDNTDAAIERLTELAHEAGITDEQITSPDVENWAAVAALIEAAGAAPDEPNEPEAPTWSKGDACKYRPIDPKTKKPAVNKQKKPLIVECQIQVLTKTTADLLNLTDKKTKYPKVKLEDLLPA